jgi:hypothetical protein
MAASKDEDVWAQYISKEVSCAFLWIIKLIKYVYIRHYISIF